MVYDCVDIGELAETRYVMSHQEMDASSTIKSISVFSLVLLISSEKSLLSMPPIGILSFILLKAGYIVVPQAAFGFHLV